VTVEIRHLRAFVAIAEEGSISAAARRLLVTQPALSRTLRQLEDRIGVPLVARSTTGLTLSPEGDGFLARARAALGAFDDALGERRPGRPLRLGHAWSAAGTHTAVILRAWSQQRPDVPLEVRRSDDRFAGLLRDLADVAFLRGDVADPRLHLEPAFTEDRVAAVPVDHPLAGRDEVTMADLAGYDLVVNTVSGTSGPYLWPEGARPGIAARVTTLEDWLLAIATGQGVSITPASTMALHRNPGVAYVPMRDAPPLDTYIGWRKGPGHPARREFGVLARAVLRSAVAGDRGQPQDGDPGGQ